MGQSLVVFCILGEKEMDARIEKKKARAPPNIICNTLITMTTTTKRDEKERNCLSTRTAASSETATHLLDCGTDNIIEQEREKTFLMTTCFFFFSILFFLLL
jgi:hypothetical protein